MSSAGAFGPSAVSPGFDPMRVQKVGRATADFTLETGDGYLLSVEGRGRRVTLTVYGHEVVTTYAVRGQVSTRRLEARFGKLGRISARFKRSGRVRQLRAGQCDSKAPLKWFGVFTGTIRFEGENGYTGIRTRHAEGTVSSASAAQACVERPPSGARARTSQGRSAAIPVLAAYTSQPRVVFAAIGDDDSGEFDITFFVAEVIERRESMRIQRAALTVGGPRSFVRPGGGLGSAVVHPPKPFSGGASFSRSSDGSPIWEGTLNFPFPGIGRTALSGPAFTADLAKPRRNAEFRRMLGLPAVRNEAGHGETESRGW